MSHLTICYHQGGTIFINTNALFFTLWKYNETFKYLFLHLGNLNFLMNKYTEVDIANRKIVALVPRVV